MTVNPSDIQGLPGEGESVGNAMMELLQDLAEGGGGGQASDVTVDPAVEGETNVQDALEALASGGSQPIATKTITAAEVTDRWDADNSVAAIAITDVSLGDQIIWVVYRAGDFDNNCDLTYASLFARDASSFDVMDGGEGLRWSEGGSEGTYKGQTSIQTDAGSPPSVHIDYAIQDATVYVLITGDDAPTTGSIYVTATVLRAG